MQKIKHEKTDRQKTEQNKKRRDAAFKLAALLSITVILIISAFVTSQNLWNDLFEYIGIGSAASLRNDRDKLTVHFVDVGQGDCSVIAFGDELCLVDGGPAESYTAVIACIKSLGYDEIDCIFLSHAHADHVGALADICRRFPVKNVVYPLNFDGTDYDEYRQSEFFKEASKSGAKFYAAIPGDTYEFSKLRFSVFFPSSDDFDLNESSALYRLDYLGTSCLFTGDISAETEALIIKEGYNIDVDLLKIPHHGSKYSSSEDFIAAVSPQYAVVSCSAGNTYGHPAPETLSRYEKFGTEVLRTDYDSTVCAESDGIRFEMFTKN